MFLYSNLEENAAGGFLDDWKSPSVSLPRSLSGQEKRRGGDEETAIGGASVSVTLFDIGRPKDVFRLQMRKFFLRIGCLFFVFKP